MAQIGHGVDVVDLGLAHRGNAELQFGHAGVGERTGDGEFVRSGKDHPGGLFAIAKRCVNEVYRHGMIGNPRRGWLEATCLT